MDSQSTTNNNTDTEEGYIKAGSWIKKDTVDDNTKDTIDAFVQVHTEYYRKKWQDMRQRCNDDDSKMLYTPSFNLGAFFLSLTWLLYRRMYLYGAYCIACYFVMAIIIAIISIKLNISLPDPQNLFLGLSVYLGFFSNGLYFHHMKKMVAKVEKENPNDIQKNLKKIGGVSIMGIFAFAIVFIAALVGLAAVLRYFGY